MKYCTDKKQIRCFTQFSQKYQNLTCFESGPNARSNLNVFVVDEFGFSLTTTSFPLGTSTTEQDRCDFSEELRGLHERYIIIDIKYGIKR